MRKTVSVGGKTVKKSHKSKASAAKKTADVGSFAMSMNYDRCTCRSCNKSVDFAKIVYEEDGRPICPKCGGSVCDYTPRRGSRGRF